MKVFCAVSGCSLNLCVKNAINGNVLFSKLLKKCRAIVGRFKHNVTASEKLIEIEKHVKLPVL